MPKIENKGVIADPRTPQQKALDYIASGSPIPYEIRVENWDEYLPVGVPQSTPKFDTMACTHFSVCQSIESQIKWLWANGKLTKECTDFLMQYCKGGLGWSTFQCSPRFAAIMGENTPKGNYFQRAWDSARHDGMIPDSLLPFGGTTWGTYHDLKKITAEMRDIGRKFLEFFEIQYDWVTGYDNEPNFNTLEATNNKKFIKQCPLNIGIPQQVYHSIIMTRFDTTMDSFDHYVPYHRTPDLRPVGLAIRGVVTVKTGIPPLARLLKFGMSGADVKQLQANLRKLGYFNYIFDTGYFGLLTQLALKSFQKDYNIPQTGNYWTLSHAQIYKLLK